MAAITAAEPGPAAGPAGVAPFRWTPSLIALFVVITWELLWICAVVAGWRISPLVGWVALPPSCLLTAWVCWQAARRVGLTPVSRRFWRTIGCSIGCIGLAGASHTYDAFTAPVRWSTLQAPLTTGIYAFGVLIALWGLLRLPGSTGRTGGWARFVLDSGTVILTVALFAWYFSFRLQDQWTQATGSIWPVLAVVILSFVAIMAYGKVVSAGLTALDRQSLRLLAAALIGSAILGALSPQLTMWPEVANPHLSFPVACVLVGLAADRQARAAGVVFAPRRPRARWTLTPYVAVVATNVLLLARGGDPGGQVLIAVAVALTFLVIVRQVMAFSDNARLLARVDGSLHRLRQIQDQLEHQAQHDDLTGLANRRLLDQRISEAVAEDSAETVHVALVDLDDFKTINDRLGHAVGDQLLVAVAERLRDALRPTDVVARLGGDEFGLLLRVANIAQADAVLERIITDLQQPVRAGEHNLLVQASAGVTDAHGTADPYELLRRADVAMYTAKDHGRGRAVRYEPGMDSLTTENAQLGADLVDALHHDQLHLVYQPIVSLPDGATVGVETLIRWVHPERGFISPVVFIPLAERNGTIVELGHWILRQSCRQVAAWDRDLGEASPAKISVNVSARQLNEPDFPASVAAVLAETGVAPHRLVVEVTETAVFDRGRGLGCLVALRDLGIQVALDDFGTGHSSLGLLLTVPVDILKVDKSFVDNITMAGHQHTAIVTGLLHISEGLNLVAVAEGVETAEQAGQLHHFGYRFAQGYHFARPMPAADITARLRRPAVLQTAGADLGAPALGASALGAPGLGRGAPASTG